MQASVPLPSVAAEAVTVNADASSPYASAFSPAGHPVCIEFRKRMRERIVNCLRVAEQMRERCNALSHAAKPSSEKRRVRVANADYALFANAANTMLDITEETLKMQQAYENQHTLLVNAAVARYDRTRSSDSMHVYSSVKRTSNATTTATTATAASSSSAAAASGGGEPKRKPKARKSASAVAAAAAAIAAKKPRTKGIVKASAPGKRPRGRISKAAAAAAATTALCAAAAAPLPSPASNTSNIDMQLL